MGITYEIREDIIWYTTQGSVDFVDGIRTLQNGFTEASESTAGGGEKKMASPV